MFLKRLFASRETAAERLYRSIVAAARQPKFYLDHGVPDTVDGRFDMISLHMFLVLERLRAEGEGAATLRQDLTDAFFKDMDRSLREMGVGDLSVGKKVRKMAEAFYGRLVAYTQAMGEPDPALQSALARNIFPDVPDHGAASLATLVRQAQSNLARQPGAALEEGRVEFA